jgi:hypothetical protein
MNKERTTSSYSQPNEQTAKLQVERGSAMLRAQDDAPAKIKEQIKAYGSKTSDFNNEIKNLQSTKFSCE